MKWLRLYPEARTDAKLRSLRDSEHRVWFNLLCLAAEQEERGTIRGYSASLLALEVAKGRGPLLESTLERLVALNVVCRTADTITFVHFADRQYAKPSDRPEEVAKRVQKHRKRPRNADVTPETLVTTPEQNRTEQSRGRADRSPTDQQVDPTETVSPLTAAACQDRFFEGTNPVGALVDMAVQVEGIDKAHVDGGGLAGVIKKFGRGKNVWEALRAYTANRAVGQVHEYMMKVLANGRRQGTAGYGQAGGLAGKTQGRAGEGSVPQRILTPAEYEHFSAERRAEEQGVQAAGAGRGDGAGQPVSGDVPGQEVAGDPAEQPGDDD